jgi:hypothetical protein
MQVSENAGGTTKDDDRPSVRIGWLFVFCQSFDTFLSSTLCGLAGIASTRRVIQVLQHYRIIDFKSE